MSRPPRSRNTSKPCAPSATASAAFSASREPPKGPATRQRPARPTASSSPWRAPIRTARNWPKPRPSWQIEPLYAATLTHQALRAWSPPLSRCGRGAFSKMRYSPSPALRERVPSAARRVRGAASTADIKEVDGVAGPDLALVGFRDVGVDLVDDRPRIGPFVLDVREVGREHDAVDADVLALLDRHTLVLHAEIDVLAHIVARQFLQGLEPEIFLRPAEVALVPQIHVLEPERDPAEAGLGKEYLELRMALEHAGQDQLGDADRRCQPEIAQPFEERPPQPLHDYGVFLRVFESRLRGAGAGAVELDVHRDRHLHIDCGGPELVVLGSRIAFGIGQCAQ